MAITIEILSDKSVAEPHALNIDSFPANHPTWNTSEEHLSIGHVFRTGTAKYRGSPDFEKWHPSPLPNPAFLRRTTGSSVKK